MGHRAARRLAYLARVFVRRGGAMSRRFWRPGLPAPRQFGVVDQNIHPARRGVNQDAVAVAQERQRATDKRFRRDIADAHAAGGAGEAAVGDQSHLLPHALAVDQRGDAEHLPHAGSPDWSLVADHQHLSRLVVALTDRLDTTLLVLKNARAALERQRLQSGAFYHRAIGTKIALQHGDAAIRHDRSAGGKDYLAIDIVRMS